MDTPHRAWQGWKSRGVQCEIRPPIGAKIILDICRHGRRQCDRIEGERKFSLAKQKCGMNLITTKLMATAYHSIALSVVLLNLRKLWMEFCHNFFQTLFVELYFGFKMRFRYIQ